MNTGDTIIDNTTTNHLNNIDMTSNDIITMTFDEYVAKYFTPVELSKYKYRGVTYYSKYIKNSTGYIYSGEDVDASLDYYNRTGNPPK